MTRIWTEADIRALGVRTDLVTACSIAYGCSRNKAYAMKDAGELDFPVLKAGNRYVVATSHLLRLLGLTPDMSEAAPASAAIASESPRQEEVDGAHRTLRAAG